MHPGSRYMRSTVRIAAAAIAGLLILGAATACTNEKKNNDGQPTPVSQAPDQPQRGSARTDY